MSFQTALNILVLHRLGDLSLAPRFLVQYVFSIKTCMPNNNYLFHDVSLPLPDFVQDTVFDAIILDVSFLCVRWAAPEQFEKLKEDYSFVKYSHAVKIAFPQDEYDCNELLDDWLCDWGVDVVFSVISSNWDVLYPRYHRLGKLRLGYTGYIDESLASLERRPFAARSIDIGYRARKLPPYFGKIGETKWTIGRDVALKCRQAGLAADIVIGDQGFLAGRAWLDFINSCKFTLGANSGSSLLDPRGEIQRIVRAYLTRHPDAPFAEVENQCFHGLDGRHSFTAISPRIMEAALLDSCQILVEGEYSGVVRSWEHYIPIAPDAANFQDVLEAMRDTQLVTRLITNCRAVVLECKELRYQTRNENVINEILNLLEKKHINSSCRAMKKTISRYDLEMVPRYKLRWAKQKYRRKLVQLIDRYPSFSAVARSSYSFVRDTIIDRKCRQ